MTSEALERWERIRAHGKWRYILVKGVLSYGLPMFIAMTFVMHRVELRPRFIGISAIIWAVAGALFGILMWLVLERQYRRAKSVNAA